MQPAYNITTSPAFGLLSIKLRGFFSLADVASFGRDRDIAVHQLRCPPNQHVTLCDVTECKLQTGEVFAAFQQLILDPRVMSRRFAMVVGSSLARMQVRRLLARDNAQVFEDRASAETWLLG